jgi:hypothetical protein
VIIEFVSLRLVPRNAHKRVHTHLFNAIIADGRSFRDVIATNLEGDRSLIKTSAEIKFAVARTSS